MIRMENKYLLMIEPDREVKPSLEPVKDELTEKTAYILSKAEKSKYSYRGFHITQCGKISDNYDWILPNGMITHSLALYYIEHYRPFIPKEEIDKIEYLYEEFKKESSTN